MLQATKNKYTVETLKPLNILYDHEHWLTQQDVDMANGYVELIERTRSEKTPQIAHLCGQIREILRQRPHRETQKYGRTDFHL